MGVHLTLAIIGQPRKNMTSKKTQPVAPIHGVVYARHGHEFMGCESPVRDWESQGDQYTK
jgi:hypothetical protein